MIFPVYINIREIFMEIKTLKNISEKYYLFFILIFFAGGCAVATHSDCVYNMGNFTGQWYDYYNRACFCIDAGNYQAAIDDLHKAVIKRAEDKRWANTYGMHFADYFPHRETGIAYYFTGDYDNAEKELELSIYHEPSEKAYHYLDKVRTRIMELEKRETGKPLLKIISPSEKSGNELWTRDDPVIIKGIAEDKRYVSEITLSGKPVFIKASSQHLEFQEELAMNEGEYEIELTARNLIRGEEKKSFVLNVDRSGPIILITEFVPGTGFSGYVRDKAGIKSFIMESEGKISDIPIETNGCFFIPLSSAFTLIAADTLGNETKTDMSGILAESQSQMFAQYDQNITDVAFPKEPRIILKDWSDQEILFEKSIEIRGQIQGKSYIRELVFSVENENRYEINYKIDEKGYFLSFHQTLNLNEGRNIITVSAKDEAGNTSVKQKVIIHRIPEVLQPVHRYTLKMYPFENLFFFRFINEKKEAVFQNSLITGMMSQKRFQIVKDEKLQNFFDKNNIRISDTGNFQRCDSLLLGSTDIDRNGIEIIARMVDVRTSEILAVKDVYSEHQDDSALNSMAHRLSEKFHREFPLKEGIITEIKDENVFADIEDKAVKEGWSLIVYRNEPGSDSEIITDALKGEAGKILIRDPAEIRAGDKVITR